MYSVSNKYKLDMKEPVARLSIRGTIGNKAFTESNISGGSFSITNQCVDSDELLLGAAYIGELQATFQDVDIDRYEWVGKVITAYHIRIFSDDTSEEVPLGVFTISEATWSADGVSVIAYDNMSKLDKTAAFDATTGSAYGILSNICLSCGLTLGMTEAQVEALPNGTEILGLWAENDIETYRDMISWLAQTLASIVLVDRQGRIYLKTYGMTSVDEVGQENRFLDVMFADFESRYSGLSVVDLQSKTTKYYGTAQDIYLTYNLGSNPFMQYGTPTTKDSMARAILDSLAATAYIPFSVTMLGDPAYDLGDVITLSGGMGDGSKHFVIQRFNYQLHNNYTAEGVGKNPDVANAKSKTDKNLAGLASQVNAKEFQYYLFRNVRAINVGNEQERDVINMRFTSLSATAVIFQAEVLIEIDTLVSGITYNDAVAVVTYYIDNNKVMNYYPTETYVDGKHVLHLLYPMKIEGAQLTRFVATLRMTGGSAYIPPQGVNAIISGQSLMATDEWDGYIDAEDKFGTIDLRQLVVEDIYEVVTVTPDIPYEADSEDEFGEYALRSIQLEDNFTEMVLIDKKMMSSYTHAELHDYTHAQLNNEYIHG